MSDERIAALRYFLDLDNPYLGVDQDRIREGIAALKSLESQNQALQERVEEALKYLDDCDEGMGTPSITSLRVLLSPTQETDPE
jgi:hypothetical protein